MFDNIRKIDPGLFNKVVPVSGDISCEKLGLSEEDQSTLISNVNVVFHLAATVRFDEPFNVAANLNIFGTKRILDLSLKMKQLKVHDNIL